MGCKLEKNGLTSFVYTDDYSIPDLMYNLINRVKNMEGTVQDIPTILTNVIKSMADSGELAGLVSEQILEHKLNCQLSYTDLKSSVLEDNSLNLVLSRTTITDGGSGVVFVTKQTTDMYFLMDTVGEYYLYYIPINNIYNIRLISPTSTQLETLINAHPIGSKFYFPKGTYVFNNINVNTRLQECTFYGDGTGTYAGVGSSNITTNSNGAFFLNINAGAYNLYFKDLYFYGDKIANGINFAETQPTNPTFSRADDIYFNNCVFGSYARTGVQINTSCGYVYFKNCSFLGGDSTQEAYGVRIGESYSNTSGALPNYVYFIESDFSQTTGSNNGGIAFYNGSQFFVQNCDFALLTSPAILLANSSSSRASIADVYIRNNMFFNVKSSGIKYNSNQLILNSNIIENTFVLNTIALDITGSNINTFNLINNIFRNFSNPITALLTINNTIISTNLTGNCNLTGVYLTENNLYRLRADSRIFPQPRCEHNVPNGNTTFVLGGTSLASANRQYYFNMLNAVNPGNNVTSTKSYNSVTNELTIVLNNTSQNQYRIEYVLDTNWRT